MKKFGIVGKIFYLMFILFLCGLGLALLSSFNWDILSMLAWIVNFIWNIILSIAEQIMKSPVFQSLVHSGA